MRLHLIACLAGFFAATTALGQGAPAPRMPSADGSAVKTPEVEPQPQTKTRSIGGGKQEQFVLPSGNIGCIYTPEGGTPTYRPLDGGPELACDRVEPRYVRATLSASGPASLDRQVGDASCCSATSVLDYGQTWRQGPFSCTSTRTGLTCEREDGHSFFLSRRRIDAN
ncbi:hypothetical protein P6U16_16180 [Rhizobium sp. 32-5/1]|uniref:DUF6636 domain-containing protein n=1 Tax=Rhizobium sp. 32-5/1 TaxID=3019602 RepID=UPI00240D7398|nr:DUF6636 domain-containing protein [Rhizobium sp. 32-5/1]WEZ82587.1 hypothetical protein P6U16_16180 [Rhizobium sp. 32-5/1]